MKKKILFTLALISSLSVFIGCDGSSNTSFSENNLSETNTNEDYLSTDVSKSFEEMLLEISNENITYHSDYLVYYYENAKPNDILELQRFDVYALITEDLYDLTAYHYGKELIASYAHLEKDSQGYVSYSDIDINNQLITNRAIDNTNNPFLWEESVYYNLIKYLSIEDFNKDNDEEYEYTGNLNKLPLNIIHTAIPTSFFDIESFKVIIKNNKIDSFVFQEKESDQAYEDCMYGRKITLKFEDIGTTKINRIKPYAIDPNNDALGEALNHIKSQNNYAIISEGILDDGSVMRFQETYITETDILQRQHLEEGVFLTGCHTYNDELYIFESVSTYLLGNKAASDVTVSTFLPTFSFSKDVFEYLGEDEEGYKVYRPYSTMKGVLDYVDVISQYSEAYYSPAGDINFFVKDNQLAKIEFPFYVYSSVEPLIAVNRLTFKNYGKTKIGSTTWNSFVTEIPVSGATSWFDDEYMFKFQLNNTTKVETNIGNVIEKCIGDASLIPYFISENGNYNASGNYSSSDNVVYLSLTSSKGIDEDTIELASTILLEAGFTYKNITDEIMSVDIYKKDDIVIELISIPIDNYLEIAFTLPVGDILTLA